MTVPAYQIQNILTLYCRKLEQSWHNKNIQAPPLTWKINVIAQSKKEMVINKVTESILSKITRMGPRQYMKQHAQADVPPPAGAPFPGGSPEERNLFSFTVLDEKNDRIQKSILLGTYEV